ncbi:MFS transporter [Veillonella sp.]|uniref:MFS transporter n=1 Tax=Veillonella sp. TaxID=1926307 RepID=UPI00290038EE|nr:MFS transporter [Veillonella sp.]MDU1128979.1 MFS transporter [Veillonella sp.]
MRSEIVANWQPENPEFWEKFGKKIAKQNLVISTIALTLSFCVWYLWATIAAQLNGAGFNFTTDQLFTLAALPGLVGATLRFVYTYMPALIGGKNWTFISTLILLVPVVWLGFAVQDTTTSYTTFMILTVLIGLAGGNFSSSMAYIGNFFPKSEKGTALGINGGVGNLGVSVIYFLAPFAMGSTALGSVFGVTPAIIKGNAVYLANAAFMWIVPLVVILALMTRFMDNLPLEKPNPKNLVQIFGNKHTWAFTLLYTCSFGAFSGYAAALGGTKVTFISLITLCVTTALIPVGVNMHNFPFFFAMSVLTFVCCGFATGATFRMIPHVFGNPLLSSLITGFVAAVAAYGAFITPKIFGFVYSTFGNIHPAFAVLLAFNIVTVAVCFWFYVRKGANMNV